MVRTSGSDHAQRGYAFRTELRVFHSFSFPSRTTPSRQATIYMSGSFIGAGRSVHGSNGLAPRRRFSHFDSAHASPSALYIKRHSDLGRLYGLCTPLKVGSGS